MLNGILIGCDINQEWLLSWWWDHYSAHNSYPVAMADFGLSEKAIAWCKERMHYIPPNSEFSLHEVESNLKKTWENRSGEGIWSFRRAWFKKPLAFLATPFERTCWLDLDCEVKGSLEGLFQLPPCDIAILPEAEFAQEKDRMYNLLLPGEIHYNSGVVLFRKKAPILEQWVQEAMNKNHRHMGDENALSRAIYLHEPSLLELPEIYHWKKSLSPNSEALVIHYFGKWKVELLKQLHPHLFRTTIDESSLRIESDLFPLF